MGDQEILLEPPEREYETKGTTTSVREPKLRLVNRDQKSWTVVEVEELIGEDHKTRAIWELAERLDLSQCSEPVRTARWLPRAHKVPVARIVPLPPLDELEPGELALAAAGKLRLPDAPCSERLLVNARPPRLPEAHSACCRG